MKKFSVWAILIVVLITSTLVKTNIPSSGKHNYKIIHQDCSKTIIGNNIKTTAVKKLQPVSPDITARVNGGHLIHNNKVQKIFLIDNRERKTKILLRKQRARSSIDKNEHMFYHITRRSYSVKGLEYGRLQRKNYRNCGKG